MRTFAPRLIEVGLVASWAFAYFTARGLMERGLHQGTLGIYAVCVAAVVLCVVFHRVRYDHLDDVFRRLTRATAVGVLVYQLVEPPDLTLANPAAQALQNLVVWAWLPTIAAAIIALWRPVFLALPALHILVTRIVTEDISGFPISILDIHYMVDMSMLLAASASGLWLFAKARGAPILRGLSTENLSQAAAFVAIGVHLGNYFWSGVAKLQIGPDWSYWMLENTTEAAMLPSLAIGILPFSGAPGLVQAAYDGLAVSQPLGNIALVALQLLAIVAVLHVSLLRLATIGYDLMHVAIFLLLGAFFWPWIWNNLSILIALRGKTGSQIGWMPRLICVGVIVSGMSYHYARSAQLAWFDVPVMKLTTIEARAGDGPWAEVPSSFYLAHSYSMGHGVMGFGRELSHYPPGARGNTMDLNLQRTSRTCPKPGPLDYPETNEARADRIARTGAFLRAHHAKMLSRAEWLPDDWYYWRVHHFPSNPAAFQPFSALDLADVTAYRVRIRSVCMGLEGGQLNLRSMTEDVLPVPLTTP